MTLYILTALALGAVVVFRRGEILAFHWQPDRGVWVALAAGLLAFGLSALILPLGAGTGPARFITFIIIWAGCGFVAPWGYTLLVEKAGVAALGLTRARLGRSLVLNLCLGAMYLPLILSWADLSGLTPATFARGATVLLVGNLFELFLYYGFIHLRLERAFGILPAILVTSAVYVLWHVGTQLPLEADPWAASGKLFLVGVFYQSVFSLTRNLLTIWPFFVGGGVLLDFLVNIGSLEAVIPEFPWALATLALMALSGLAMAVVLKRSKGPA